MAPNQHTGVAQPYHNAEWLREKYHNECLSQAEIADECGVAQGTICTWLDRHSIPSRTAAESREERGTGHRPTKDGPHTDAGWLREKYYDEHMSVTEMAEVAGVTDATIIRNMDRVGIERRPGFVTRVLRDPGAGFVHADANGYETLKHSVDDHTYNYKLHRLLAIAEWGYEAVDGAVVHHKNGLTWDNRVENLELLDGQSAHAEHHHADRERDEYGRYV